MKAASSVSGAIAQLIGQTSTSTGTAPAILIAASVAGNVKAGSTTGPVTTLAIKGAAIAAVPLDVSTHAVHSPPQVAANQASSRTDSGPKFENRFAS